MSSSHKTGGSVNNSSNANSTTQKRKQSFPNDGAARKRARIQEARTVRTQTSDKAFSNGDLNVDKFVKAREYEIKALEDGLKRSKQVLSQRAFQDVPKDLRRRTASHNVKRVPKRLRPRAVREVIFGLVILEGLDIDYGIDG